MPRPGKAVIAVMASVLGLWVLFAVCINWLHVGEGVFLALVGSDAVLHGQVWRLLTASVLHQPSDPGHVIFTLLGLYFLAPTLEDKWGTSRMLKFLFGAAAFAFALQVLVGALIPKLGQPMWLGGLGMVEAVAVAWALGARNQTVRLFFVLPISGTMLLVFIFGMSVLNVIAMRAPAEGLVTPFGGMLAGWLFGDTSPLRPMYLKWRLQRIQAETRALTSGRVKGRAEASGLRVIKGGGGGGPSKPKDKKWLN